MKITKRLAKVLTLILTLATILSVSSAFALTENTVNAESGEYQICAEEFAWYYRLYNGEKQKRCWSLTYGYWVTDWMPV